MIPHGCSHAYITGRPQLGHQKLAELCSKQNLAFAHWNNASRVPEPPFLYPINVPKYRLKAKEEKDD
jgi:hypothetical protein